MTIEETLMVMSGDLGWLIFATTIIAITLVIAVAVMVFMIWRLENRVEDLKQQLRYCYRR